MDINDIKIITKQTGALILIPRHVMTDVQTENDCKEFSQLIGNLLRDNVNDPTHISVRIAENWWINITAKEDTEPVELTWNEIEMLRRGGKDEMEYRIAQMNTKCTVACNGSYVSECEKTISAISTAITDIWHKTLRDEMERDFVETAMKIADRLSA